MTSSVDESNILDGHNDDLSRRELLSRTGRAATAVVVAGALLGDTTGAADARRTSRRGGNLTVGVSGGGPTDSLDAHMTVQEVATNRGAALYEGLTIPECGSGRYVNLLAESIEPHHGTNAWTIRVRHGIEFHNGKTLAADDVLFSIHRMITLPGSTAAGSLSPVILSRMRKLDARTVRVFLNQPYTVFPQVLGTRSLNIVPVGYNPHAPVGTGPFKYQSFSPGNQSVFVRNSNWWGGYTQSKGPFVDQLTIVDIDDDNARVNALLSGQVDAINSIPYGQYALVKSHSNARLLISHAPVLIPLCMRVDKAPFTDARVRQAFRLIANRPQLVAQALAGHGRVQNDLYSPNDPLSIAAKLPQRHQDLEQAKSLLKHAGQTDIRITMNTAPVFAGVVESSQVFAAQAARAGVQIQLNQGDPGAFWGSGFKSYLFAPEQFSAQPYLVRANEADGTHPVFNDTDWRDGKYEKLFREAMKTAEKSRLREITAEMQRIQWNSGGYIVWGSVDTIDAFASKTTGWLPSATGYSLGQGEFWRVSIT